MMIRNVMLVSRKDWANVGFELAKALRSVGVEATMYIRSKHRFGYPEQGTLYGRRDLKPVAEKADAIIFVHTQYVETYTDLSKKKVAVFHTGSAYRKSTGFYNNYFDPKVGVTFVSFDLYSRGGKNEKLLNAPIDLERIKPIYDKIHPRKLVVGHYSRGHKGTVLINKVMEKLKEKDIIYKVSGEYVPWKKQLRRMSLCDVIIESMKLQPIRAFGITALEAAALGKIVVSSFTESDRYKTGFGPCAIQVARSADELEGLLLKLSKMSDEKILKLKTRSRQWVQRCHSYKAVGTRLLAVLGGLK